MSNSCTVNYSNPAKQDVNGYTDELAEEFAKGIGMIPLKLNKEWPGYILNSLLIPWFKAACTLCANGVADPETVDMTWQLATGSDPGQTPFRKLDKIGLGLAYHIFGMDPKEAGEIYVDGQKYDAGDLGVPSFMNVADAIVNDYIQTQANALFDMD